jgi:hypothetical protein
MKALPSSRPGELGKPNRSKTGPALSPQLWHDLVDLTASLGPPPAVKDPQKRPVGMQVNAGVVEVGFGVESHQVSSLWKLDTSGSIPNSSPPRGGLDEYQCDATDHRIKGESSSERRWAAAADRRR